MSEVKPLYELLQLELGKKNIEKTELPNCITGNLNPAFPMRLYQQKAFQFFLSYWQERFDGKPRQNHQLLFHMATGSGKTLMMAGLILYLYEQGFRNFLFFVNSTNIINKTRDNFLNAQSGKYLFAESVSFGDKRVMVREVENFQAANQDDINIVFSTIQGLHMSLNTPRENGLTYDDFEDQKIVWLVREISGLFPPLFAPQKKSCWLQKRTCSSEPAKQAYPQAVASAPLSLAGDRLWVSRVINTI